MHEGMTAGSMCLKAHRDTTKIDPIEIGYVLTEKVAQELAECVRKHDPIFNEDEYCVVRILAGDPLLANLKRIKYYGYLYLPSPRPNQSVFLWSKKQQRFLKRLWTLPNAWTMAQLSYYDIAPAGFQEMKLWSDAFFAKRFWPFIRKYHNIDMLSEIEYLKTHREELIKAGCKDSKSFSSEPFDFSKVMTEKVIYPGEAFFKKDRLDGFGQTEALNWDVSPHKFESLPEVS